MLPEGFERRLFVHGTPALYCAGRQVAVPCDIPSGDRVDFALKGRSEFFGSLEAAQDYCDRWAAKWEREIKFEVGRTVVSGWDSHPPTKP